MITKIKTDPDQNIPIKFYIYIIKNIPSTKDKETKKNILCTKNVYIQKHLEWLKQKQKQIPTYILFFQTFWQQNINHLFSAKRSRRRRKRRKYSFVFNVYILQVCYDVCTSFSHLYVWIGEWMTFNYEDEWFHSSGTILMSLDMDVEWYYLQAHC